MSLGNSRSRPARSYSFCISNVVIVLRSGRTESSKGRPIDEGCLVDVRSAQKLGSYGFFGSGLSVAVLRFNGIAKVDRLPLVRHALRRGGVFMPRKAEAHKPLAVELAGGCFKQSHP